MRTRHDNRSYNSRLFSGGLRRWVHMARFRWLADVLSRYEHTPQRVVELGCFDAKSIDFLPEPPEFYLGLDANWDGGLDIGRKRWGSFANIELTCCTSPEHLPTGADPFDTVISMETIEHLPPDEMELYLDGLATLASGIVLITVPNEIGSLFAAKWLFKAALGRNTYRYSARELLAAALGRTDRIERCQHKGFDYRRLMNALAARFEMLEVTPLPISWLPVPFGVTIGIVARAPLCSDALLGRSAAGSHSRHCAAA